MWNKKILWLSAGTLVFLMLLVTVLFLSIKKKEKSENALPTKTPLPTTVIVQKKPTSTPTISKEDGQLSLVKNKLIDGYEFEDIILDYRPKSDLIIVFYNRSKFEAQKQVIKFFKEEEVQNLEKVKIEYIGLKKELEEPPAGFFR